jgi:Kef-type K+ transport system membrane component KefB
MIAFADPFGEIAAVLVVSAALGALALWLRQPLLIAFIGAGILLGPSGIDLVRAHEQLDLFAELGIGLLLFIVGLKLDPHLIRAVGPVALIAGIGQIVITAVMGFIIGVALGLTTMGAFYLAAAVTFSSTIVIVKLLSDKREIDALHGRISLGILIMQDIVVVLLMIGLTAFGDEASATSFTRELLEVAVKGLGFLALVALATRYVLPALLHGLARWPELLALFAIAWAIGLASLGVALGFSKEVGAFVAGVAIAWTPYKAVLAARLVNLRDFMLLFFFINLGIQIDFGQLEEVLVAAVLISLFVLVVKPLLIMALVAAAGYSRRTSVTSGLAMGQISEFSLILAALGLSLGHIDDELTGIITLVGLITMGISTYMILYDSAIYERLAPALKGFRHKGPRPGNLAAGKATAGRTVDIIVFGLGRYGRNLAQELKARNHSVLGVDFDPQRVRFWAREGLVTLYGDLEDEELYHALPLAEAQWVVSTIPGRDRCLVLLHALKSHKFAGRVALTAETIQHRDSLEKAGAHLVLLPYRDAASRAADTLGEA